MEHNMNHVHELHAVPSCLMALPEFPVKSRKISLFAGNFGWTDTEGALARPASAGLFEPKSMDINDLVLISSCICRRTHAARHSSPSTRLRGEGRGEGRR
jgi:hypothetical protein